MLITDQFSWNHDTFESYIEGMCRQIELIPGPYVVFWGYNTPEVILTLFACWRLGKIACPLNIRVPKAEGLLKTLNTSLFQPKIPHPQKPKFKEWNPEKLAVFLSTSGSTGSPKIACLSLENLILNALGSNKLIPLCSEDCWALTLPVFHVGGIGILMRSYLAKSQVLLSSNWEIVTHFSVVPTQLYRFLKQDQQFSALKLMLIGGAPIHNIEYPWPILETYGMTEMGSQIVTNHQVHPYAELKIGPNQEIWVKGKTLFQGYYTDSKIILPLNQEGWFVTQDLGIWADKRFKVLGRSDNLLISGGENIHPEEIEESIFLYCDHLFSIVIGIPDCEFGERPAVFLTDPSQLFKIQNILASYLPKYKIPVKAFLMPPQAGLKPNRSFLKRIALDSLKELSSS